MIQQKGFGLIILLIAVAIIAITAVFFMERMIGSGGGSLQEKKSAIDQAEAVKDMLEKKSAQNSL